MTNKFSWTTVVLFLALISTIPSCTKEELEDPIVEAFIEGAKVGFTDFDGVINSPLNLITVTASNTAQSTTLNVYIRGTAIGDYTGVGASSDKGAIGLQVGTQYYYSDLAGGLANIKYTERDDDEMIIKGTFSGVVVNQTDPNDKRDISNGIFRTKFSF
jgi:hypothetical protein